MEKKKLNEQELEILRKQYYELTETIRDYKSNMMSKKFAEMDHNTQYRVKMQYNWFKLSINDTVRVLIDHDYCDRDMLIDAVFNRYLRFKMRWTALKELYRIRKSVKK